MKQIQGFTLIELMITITVGAIILSIGVPSFKTMVQNNHLTTENNRLLADINYAKSEAIKRGHHVILCRSANPAAASPTCGGTTQNWGTGWLIFSSPKGENVYDSTKHTLLRIGNPTSGEVTIKTNAHCNNNLEFKGNGTTDEAGVAKFAICDSRGTSKGRQIAVSLAGRPETTSGSIASCAP